MIYFIGQYTVEGTEASTIEKLCSVLKNSKEIALDTETKRKTENSKYDVLDQVLTMLQIGVGEDQ